MTKATVTEAKVRLETLIEAALQGKRVVITRGSQPAVVLVPAKPEEPEPLQISDSAADYLAHEARLELESGRAQVHESPAAFAATLRKPRRRA
jgi:prevent-host-death family protein